MKNLSKISIITVTYNCVHVINATILSVLNQTYKNIEYIIIDGASTDGTLEIIQSYDRRITNGEFHNVKFLWLSEPDKGIYDAMNKGITMATGEWVNFMNAGDRFHSLTTLSSIFCSSPVNQPVIYGNTKLMNGINPRVVRAQHIDKIKYGIPFCHQAAFVSTNLLKRECFNLDYKVASDYDFFLSLYLHGNEHLFDKRDLIVADYDTSGVSNSAEAIKEQYLIVKRHLLDRPIIIYHWMRYNYVVFAYYLKNKLPRPVTNCLLSIKNKMWFACRKKY